MPSFYDKAIGGLPPGHSSYFESPHDRLDPSLFDGLHLKDDVRLWLVDRLVTSLEADLGLKSTMHWLHAWLAGSGITYQWEGGEGDLDVLFGVEMEPFVHHNPNFTGIPEAAVAEWADATLKQKVWPQTARARFGQRTYEVTFYWNPGTHDRIENIKPYAAYDLVRDVWAVTPPLLPHDPHSLYPADWFEAAGRDVNAAETIIRSHDSAVNNLASMNPSSPSGRNAASDLARARASAKALFDEIHVGRRQAFGEQGHGYGDWNNFRWQHAKSTGVIPALRRITEQAQGAADARDAKLYGGAIDGPGTIITREMMKYGRRP